MYEHFPAQQTSGCSVSRTGEFPTTTVTCSLKRSIQTLATALDEDYRKPKNLTDQVVRLLDEENVPPSDRLRLIALYVLYRDGILPSDLVKLLAHAHLPPQDGEVINNLDFLGARITRGLKEKRDPAPPLFPRRTNPPPNAEELALSRFTTAVRDMLEQHIRGVLPQDIFPYTKPDIDAPDPTMQDNVPSASLRSAKPTWAKSRLSSVEPRQRVILFMAGGATYSESRACYEVSQATSRDIFLVSSHMMTPGLYLRQVGDLSQDRRRLGLPQDAPKPKAPAWIHERPAPPPATVAPSSVGPGSVGAKSTQNVPGGPPGKPVGKGGPAPPTAALANMTLNSGTGQGSHLAASGKLTKDKEEKKKKKHHFFSSKS